METATPINDRRSIRKYITAIIPHKEILMERVLKGVAL
jgi:hypothetical protein